MSDANPCYAAVAAELGMANEKVNRCRQVYGVIHIQTVNSRHHEFKQFLIKFKGVDSGYLR